MKNIFYSVSPYGTGDIKTGSPNISITSGVATITVQQTGNIGVGCCVEYNSLKAYIAPNRIAFSSGGTTELTIYTKIRGHNSGALAFVRAIEVTSGTWAGGDAAGWLYLSYISGTFQNGEQIDRVKPTISLNIATTAGTVQGNIGNGDTEFVVKTATGDDAANSGAVAVTSIHHEYSSLTALESGFTDASHVNDTDLTNADVMVFACCYYDHDDHTVDSSELAINFGTDDCTNFLYIYTPNGNAEAINSQRHPGYYDANKYLLEVNPFGTYMIVDSQACTTLDGLQIHNLEATATAGLINEKNAVAAGTKKIRNCFLRAAISAGAFYGIYVDEIDYATTVLVKNNIIIGNGAGGYGFWNTDGDANCFVYNNTIYHTVTIARDSNSQTTLKNNLAVDCVNGYTGTFQAGCTHNAHDNCVLSECAFGQTHASGTTTGDALNKLIDGGGGLSDAQVGSVVHNTTDGTFAYVTAVDSDTQLTLSADIFDAAEDYVVYTNLYGTVTFENEGVENLHLAAGDALCKEKGTGLAGDTYPVWDDIDGDDRPF